MGFVFTSLHVHSRKSQQQALIWCISDLCGLLHSASYLIICISILSQLMKVAKERRKSLSSLAPSLSTAILWWKFVALFLPVHPFDCFLHVCFYSMLILCLSRLFCTNYLSSPYSIFLHCSLCSACIIYISSYTNTIFVHWATEENIYAVVNISYRSMRINVILKWNRLENTCAHVASSKNAL